MELDDWILILIVPIVIVLIVVAIAANYFIAGPYMVPY